MRSATISAFIACAIALGAADEARALTITPLDSDNAFKADAAAIGWTKEFGYNVKWGNNASNGDWEYSVVNGGDSPRDQQQGPVSGEIDFVFSYLSGVASLELDGLATSTWNPAASGGLNVVYLRAAIFSGNTASMTDMSLTFGASPSIPLSDLFGDTDAQYFKLSDSRFSGDWTLEGKGTLERGDPSNKVALARPMYQLKVGTATNVPDTGVTGLLLGVGLVAVAALRRAINSEDR